MMWGHCLNYQRGCTDSYAEESSQGEMIALLLGRWSICANSPSGGGKVSTCTRQREAVVGDGPVELGGDSRNDL